VCLLACTAFAAPSIKFSFALARSPSGIALRRLKRHAVRLPYDLLPPHTTVIRAIMAAVRDAVGLRLDTGCETLWYQCNDDLCSTTELFTIFLITDSPAHKCRRARLVMLADVCRRLRL